MATLQYLPYTFAFDPNKKEVLDVRLGNTCNLACRGCCGSKCETTSTDTLPGINTISRLTRALGTRLIMIDEIGEPTEIRNRDAFKSILRFCKREGILVSCFSNMVDWDEELFGYVKEGTLCVLYQLYSEDPETMRAYHQVDKVAEIKANTARLKLLAKVTAGATNVAASIYPTRDNIHEIPDMVRDCLKFNVYPFVGEFLRMGMGDENGDSLEVSSDELAKLHATVSEIVGYDYEVPLCPCILNGVHLVGGNRIIVDKNTGFACDGLSFEDAEAKTICFLTRATIYGDIPQKIAEYEQARLPYIRQLRDRMPDYYFGSCSGRPKKILDEYLLRKGN